MQSDLKQFNIRVTKNYPCIYCKERTVYKVDKLPFLGILNRNNIIIDNKIVEIKKRYQRHIQLKTQDVLYCNSCFNYQLRLKNE